MNALVLLSVILCGLIGADAQCAVSTDPKDCYTTRYDNINIDNVLKSDRLLKRYVDCLMDRGTCTREGSFLKEIVPDVLQNECSKCSPYHKQQAGKVLSFLLQNKREWWNELLEKYDKDGNFRKKYGVDDNDNDYEDDDDDTKDSKKNDK